MALELTSNAIRANEAIPTRFGCDGERISPPLRWSGAPPATAAFALIADDPDAPRGTFTHWVLYNIPGASDHLDENMPKAAHLEDGALQGPNDFGESGYGAPCPPRGQTHHYHFTLYALDAPLPLPAGASKQRVLDTLRAHILDQATLIGTYARSS
ncbi:MAG TPA: YbhB/YbcL family Raf kinase inhibitor-like protein [Ktedonobacterales bacterium]|nr:YbhB/YbcL family Raf kinase inhibitor-like protein [Ktedonobacterales bacterium]